MADQLPLKTIGTGSSRKFSEFEPTDTVPVSQGGTGAVNAALARSNLGAAATSDIVTDHGALSGLGDDDHTQYHNDARGDARYYTQSQVDGFNNTQNIAISANIAKVSADGSINTHSDVDTVSTPPSVGQVLEWNGFNWVPANGGGGGTPVYGSEYVAVENNTVVNTTSTPSTNNNITIGTFPEQYLTLVTGSLPLGIYELDVSYSWNYNNTQTDFLARCNRNSSAELFGFHRQEPKDSSGSGGDTPPGSGTNQRFWAQYKKVFTDISGTQQFVLEFASGQAGTLATMITATMIFKRVL